MKHSLSKINRAVVLITLLLLYSACTLADIPAAYVDIGYGARPMGMGGAYTGFSDDVNSVFWNPAGLTLMRESQFTAMYTKQMGLIPYGLAAYANRIGYNYIAGGFITSGNDVLRETTIIGSYASVFNLPGMGKTGIGVNVRFRQSSFGNNEDGGEGRIQGSAMGYGLDFGVMWQFSKRSRVGIFARDLVNSMTYDNTTLNKSYSENIPAGLIFGVSQRINQQSVLALDWEKSLYADTFDKVHLGAEVTVFKVIMVRGGVWQNIDSEPNRNYSTGMGLNMLVGKIGLQFDFAYLIYDLAHTPRVSLSLTH
ncbi:type IX secretion system membrane protein PorP/SprF [candidate division KSB1 bacterium]|nr:type IX secretion system membrane protein PorP/SprF [candidate division KSB1 bacterium]